MKTLIILLALTFVYVNATGQYQEVDPKIAEKTGMIKDLLNFGTNEFIKKAYDANKISDPNLTLVKVHKIYQQIVSGFNYKFEVEYSNSRDQSYLVTLIVFYQPWTSTRELTSYEIHNGAK